MAAITAASTAVSVASVHLTAAKADLLLVQNSVVSSVTSCNTLDNTQGFGIGDVVSSLCYPTGNSFSSVINGTQVQTGTACALTVGLSSATSSGPEATDLVGVIMGPLATTFAFNDIVLLEYLP